MASHSRGDYGGAAAPSDNGAPMTSKFHVTESVAEWRSREQLEPSPPSTSPAYWDTDDDEDSNASSATGPKPSDLYGKFTWKIENFSEISKRELRSNVFEVGGYKWYILVYPQGCDVCNHLSLFLCVADYDKLLPGWSHFAQFTIAVVNKDPKKSKYSDTLHRFCKKEHDWGWKKFMELSKVLDGFTVADTLVIKAQVQVIRENPHRPFRCLDCQYRRELVRVYLTNVEGICRRFVEEKKDKLGKLMEDTVRWTSFQAFWSAVEDGARRRLAREKADVILKAVVKRFFNEKEVTSTLVMDALYSGCKALDYLSRNKKGRINGVEMEETVNPIVWVDKDTFVLAGDVLALLERAATESLPPYKDDKGPQNRTKDGGSGDDFGKDSVERDERRLTELGRRTVEMFVLAHLFSNRVEVAYREAVALKRQEELIREEEAAGQAENELRAKREAAEKEKRSKKKQAKQRRKDRKEKDKEAEEKRTRTEQEQRQRQEVAGSRTSKDHLLQKRESVALDVAEIGDDDDELSGLDPVDDIVGTLGPALEDGDLDHAGWEREGPYVHHGMEASFSGALSEDPLSRSGRVSRKHQTALDDSSSSCSSDSLPSVRPSMNGSYGRPNLPEQNHVSSIRGRNRIDIDGYDNDGRFMEAEGMLRAAALDPSGTGEASSSSTGLDSETVILSLKERVQWLEQRLLEKEEEAVLLQEQLTLLQHQINFHSRRNERSVSDEAADLNHFGRVFDGRSTGQISADDLRADASASSTRSDLGEALDMEKASSSGGSQQRAIRTNGHLGSHVGSVGTNSCSAVIGDGSSGSHGILSSGKPELSKLPIPTRSRSVDSSRPPRAATPPITGPTAPALSTSGTDDPSAGSGVLPGPHFSIPMGPSMNITRPGSGPGIVSGPRSGIPLSNAHHPPPLSRSVSAAGRLGVGTDPASLGNGAPPVSPPVTPSYRNAAAGKMRSSSSSSSVHSIQSSSGSAGSTTGGATPSSVANGSGFAYASSPGLHTAPTATSSLPMSTGVTSPPLTPPQKILTGPGQVNAAVNGVKIEGSVGSASLTAAALLTFGTVTPEVLHQQQHRHEEQRLQQDLESHGEALVQHRQTEPQSEHLLGPQQHMAHRHHHHQHAQHQQLNHQQQGQGLSENGIFPRSCIKTVVNALENLNSGGGTEEFPHLDIINDLLDEDQSFGKALSAMLQQHPNPPFNRQLQLPGPVSLHKLNYGQLRSDVTANGVGGDSERGERGGRGSEEDRGSNGLREGIRLQQGPYSHTSLGRLHSQHGGLEGVTTHFWPMRNGGLPGGGNSSSMTRNGLDTHMGYPLVHLSPDCSGFSIGHNGYTVFAPSQQP